ncbi:hypothetical protein Lal_00039942, partial [Lupinus albus]
RGGDEGRRLQPAEKAAKTTQARRLAVHSNHAPRRLGWPTTKSTAAPVQARRLELRRTAVARSPNGGSAMMRCFESGAFGDDKGVHGYMDCSLSCTAIAYECGVCPLVCMCSFFIVGIPGLHADCAFQLIVAYLSCDTEVFCWFGREMVPKGLTCIYSSPASPATTAQSH